MRQALAPCRSVSSTFPRAVDDCPAAERLEVLRVGHTGVGGEIGDHAHALVGAEPPSLALRPWTKLVKSLGNPVSKCVVAAPVPAVVAAIAEVGGDPHRAFDVTGGRS